MESIFENTTTLTRQNLTELARTTAPKWSWLTGLIPALLAVLAAVWGLGVNTEFLPEGTPCRFVQIIKETEENHHEK